MFKFLQRKTSELSPERPFPNISTLGILTSNRPESFLRCLGSALENFEKFEHSGTKIIVCDDSRSNNTQVALEALNLDQQTLVYVGREQKETLLAQLKVFAKSSDINSSILDFALSNPLDFQRTTGANRNWLQLLSAGERIISCDDDTIFKYRLEDKLGSKKINVSSLYDPTRFDFYCNAEDLNAEVQWQDYDFISEHSKFLGVSLAEFKHSDLSLAHQHLSPNLDSLLSTKLGYVPTTMLGVAGDSGMGASRYLLSLEGHSRESLFAGGGSEALFIQRCLSRELIRQVDLVTLTDSPFFMMPQVGLDNRNILPPFIPIERNQDGLFAHTLSACSKNSLRIHLPASVQHRPQESRMLDKDSIVAAPYGLIPLLSMLVNRYSNDLWGETMEDNLVSLGEQIETYVASSSTQQFCIELGGLLKQDHANYINYLNILHSKYKDENPSFWSKLMKQSIDNIESLIVEFGKGNIAPKLYIEKYGQEEACQLIQKIALDYGRLLKSWPTIVEMAKELEIE